MSVVDHPKPLGRHISVANPQIPSVGDLSCLCVLLFFCSSCEIVHRSQTYLPQADCPPGKDEASTMTKTRHSICVIDYGAHRLRRAPSTMVASYKPAHSRQIAPVFLKPSSLWSPIVRFLASKPSPRPTTLGAPVQIPRVSISCAPRRALRP